MKTVKTKKFTPVIDITRDMARRPNDASWKRMRENNVTPAGSGPHCVKKKPMLMKFGGGNHGHIATNVLRSHIEMLRKNNI